MNHILYMLKQKIKFWITEQKFGVTIASLVSPSAAK